MSRMKKVRLDTLLVDRGDFVTAVDALRAILAHEVKVDDVYAASAAQQVDVDAHIEVRQNGPYVSRGGLKLAGALKTFGQDVAGLRCCDVGSSTGGFTDCLLQAGAAEVSCVDVNYGQLAWKLRSDPRVHVHERTNIRLVDPAAIGAPFDLVVADLSFIGLASLASVFAGLLCPGGLFIGLIKPQFESLHEETAAGVVIDPAVRARVVDEVCAALSAEGFQITGCVESSITGRKKHNVEFLVRAVRE